jgi:hypothetical protein
MRTYLLARAAGGKARGAPSAAERPDASRGGKTYPEPPHLTRGSARRTRWRCLIEYPSLPVDGSGSWAVGHRRRRVRRRHWQGRAGPCAASSIARAGHDAAGVAGGGCRDGSTRSVSAQQEARARGAARAGPAGGASQMERQAVMAEPLRPFAHLSDAELDSRTRIDRGILKTARAQIAALLDLFA